MQCYRARGIEPFGFFAFTPIAAPILLALILLTTLFYDRLLPSREAGKGIIESYKLRDYLTELRIQPDSLLVGRRLADFYNAANGHLRLISLIRNDARVFAPPPSLQLRENDVLMVRAKLDELHDVREQWGLINEPEFSLSREMLTDQDEIGLAEVTLAPRSDLIGQTLKSARVQQRYGLTVLAIWRKGTALSRRLTEVELQYGDILLVQGPREALNRIQEENDLLLLQEVRTPLRQPRKAPLALGILAITVGLIVLDVLSTSVALFLGAGAMVVTGCLTMERAYEVIDWRTLFIVAGMLPLGEAMETTGAAELIAQSLLGFLGDAGPVWLLAGTFLVTMLLSEVVSNDVSVLLVAPLAVTLASIAGLSPLPFMMTVAIAAGSPFITPMSHGPNLLIMGPGNYRFRDFTRVGVPVTLLVGLLTLILVPLVFPF